MVWSSVMVVVVVVISSCYGRSLSSEDLQVLPQTTSPALSHASDLPEDHGPLSTPLYHSIRKRAVFDPECKGYYDRKIWAKLNLACEDCQNLFRKPGVETECRKGCFKSSMFTSCVSDLFLPVDKYQALAAFVRGT